MTERAIKHFGYQYQPFNGTHFSFVITDKTVSWHKMRDVDVEPPTSTDPYRSNSPKTVLKQVSGKVILLKNIKMFEVAEEDDSKNDRLTFYVNGMKVQTCEFPKEAIYQAFTVLFKLFNQ